MDDDERLAILEDAMRKLQGLAGQTHLRTTPGHLQIFEVEVLGIIDSPEVNRAMGVKAPEGEDDLAYLERVLGTKFLRVEVPDKLTSSEGEETFDPRKGWADR